MFEYHQKFNKSGLVLNLVLICGIYKHHGKVRNFYKYHSSFLPSTTSSEWNLSFPCECRQQSINKHKFHCNRRRRCKQLAQSYYGNAVVNSRNGSFSLLIAKLISQPRHLQAMTWLVMNSRLAAKHSSTSSNG